MTELQGKKVWVAGSSGMVGSAIIRRLQDEDCHLLISDHKQLDLIRQANVEDWMRQNKPDIVIIAAAKVGGIYANNKHPADFLFENLAIESNIIHSSYICNVEKLLFLGSSCLYPKKAQQPIVEEALLTGALEPTNEWYAIAKIAGIKLCQAYRMQHNCDFISVMPANVYGPGDNFHPENSHVPAALLSRFHEAKVNHFPEVKVWGTGKPYREFIYVDDLADACVFLVKNYSNKTHINVGVGKDISIAEFTMMVKNTVGFKGKLTFDDTKPDGMPRRLLDVSKIKQLGWEPKTKLTDGLNLYYQWYLENIANGQKHTNVKEHSG